MYSQVLEGWAIPNKTTVERFGEAIASAGFQKIQCIDKTPLIRKSSDLMHEGCESVLPVLFAQVLEGKIPRAVLLNNIAGSRQKACLDLGIWGYKIFIAEK